MYLKCLSKRQEWIPTPKWLKYPYHSTNSYFSKYSPRVPDRPQAFRFLSEENLKIPSIFTSNLKWRRTSTMHFYACQAIRKSSVCFEDVSVHYQKCPCVRWFRWRIFWALVNCDLIFWWTLRTQHLPNSKRVYFKCVMSVASKVLNIRVIFCWIQSLN